MAKVTITWKAFGERPEINRQITSVTIEVPNDFVTPKFHNSILESIFEDTNLYRGFYWDLIQPNLSPNRTHTALSVGDEVQINDITYRCEFVGFQKVGA